MDRTTKIPKIKQFSLSFKVSNLSGKKAKVFRTIEIEPDTQTEINVLLNNAELRAMPIAGGTQGFKYTAWNFFPKNTKWKVVKNIQQPKKQIISEVHEYLQLIYGSSRFVGYSISRNEDKKIAVNTIDWPYIKNKLSQSLNEITETDVQQDIESWYGGYASYFIRTRIEDIQNIIELMQKKTIENNRGIKESIFEQTLNNYQFRNNLYHHFKFNEHFKQVFNKLLTNNAEPNNKVRIKINEIIGLLKSWVYQLQQIQDSIRIDIEWIQKPKKVYSKAGRNGEFPHFAFNFKQKITWIKEMKIPLNGRWDIKGNKYEEEKKEEEEKYAFNITDKLVNLKEVLAPLTSTIASLGSGGKFGGIDIMNSLIPDVGRFIGLEAIKIEKGNSISYTYKTDGTALTLAIDDTSDLQGNHFPRMNIGWKAIDVTSVLDLSKFTQLFYSIYEKFDLGVTEKNVLGYSDLSNLEQELNKSPISFIAHAINSIFDKTYKERTRGELEKRPWPVFFNSLLGSGLVFDHSQMMTGYSKLFFKYPPWWGTENKNQKEDCKDEQQQSENHWCTKFSFKDRKEIANPKDLEIDDISKNLFFNYSMYLPDAPIVLSESLEKGQFARFLDKEKGAGRSSAGVLNGTREIIQAVKQEYDANTRLFEGKKVIDWNNAKVSFAQLNLKKAIESVLTLPNTWTDLVSSTALTVAGIYFHQILGEALIRDGFWINVNLMHEYGMFTKRDLRVTKRMDFFPNSELWLKVEPSLDPTKLKLGWLVESFVKKK